MSTKENEFKGLAGGVNYKRGATLIGLTEKFYRKAVGGNIPDEPIVALDLGCGPGALSFALAECAHPESTIIGLDISDNQLNYARSQADKYPCKLQFIN